MRIPDVAGYVLSLLGPGEYTRHVPRKQDVAWGLADAFLLQWLRARSAVSKEGNWLAEWRVQKPDWYEPVLHPKPQASRPDFLFM